MALPSSFRTGYRLFLSWRYLRSRLVNLISVGGVMSGVAVLIIVVCIMDGFQERVRRVTRGNLSDITMTPREDPAPFPAFEQKIKEVEPRVRAVSPLIKIPVGYFYESNRRSQLTGSNRELFLMEAVGIDWEREKQVSDIARHVKTAVNPDRPLYDAVAQEREKKTVLISRRFAEKFLLGKGRGSATPEELTALLATDLSIAILNERADGTYAERTYNLWVTGVYEGEDVQQDINRLYLDIAQLRQMANVEHPYLDVRVKLKDYRDAKSVKTSLKGRFPSFSVFTWEDIQRDFLQAVESEKVLLIIVLSFIVLLGGFIILATLTLTVVEKTRDIGILSALGAPKTGVLSVFLWTGLWIGIIGSALGVGLGRLFVDNVNWVKDRLEDIGLYVFPPDIYRFREVPTIWDWKSVGVIVVGSLLMAFFAGLIPALRAARMDPVRALRHE
ncbi:MAG: FtsX-like permease family protein [Planctomycetota bacterium]|nr:FtsX-like permease family protein [Planctomycetota bacterium]